MIDNPLPSITKINLIQYWDTITPPEEVSLLMETWKVEQGCCYQIYNFESARYLIKNNFESSTLAAFESCRIPAMQADFFRYCALYLKSGLYLDADTRSLAKMHYLIKLALPRGILMDRRNRIANDFMFFSLKQDKLLEQVIRIAESNINLKISQNVWEVTGPGIMTKLFSSTQHNYLFNNISIIPVQKIKEFIGFQWEMEYKKTEKDWRRSNSIYIDNPKPIK